MPYFWLRNTRRHRGNACASSCQVSTLQRSRRSIGRTHFITAYRSSIRFRSSCVGEHGERTTRCVSGQKPDATDHVCAPVEILDSGLTHHRKATLQLGQIFPGQYLVRRSGAAGHDRENLNTVGEIKDRTLLGLAKGPEWMGTSDLRSEPYQSVKEIFHQPLRDQDRWPVASAWLSMGAQ